MNFPILFIGLTPTGRVRVYIWGQHDDHLMDWRGQNNRILLAPGCPTDFEDVDSALAWARDLFPTQVELDTWAKKAGNGQHFGDDHPLQKFLEWEVPLKEKSTYAEALAKFNGPKRYAKEIRDAVESDRRRRTLGRQPDAVRQAALGDRRSHGRDPDEASHPGLRDLDGPHAGPGERALRPGRGSLGAGQGAAASMEGTDMKRWGAVAMACLMMAWATLNLIVRPGQRTAWYVAGLVAGVLIVVLELLDWRSR